MVERMKTDKKIVLVIIIAAIMVFGGASFVLYMYISGSILDGFVVTPSVSLMATPGNTSCVITVYDAPSEEDIPWNDVWYLLSNISGNTGDSIYVQVPHNDSQVTIPREGFVNDGDIIYISGGLVEDFSYEFSLIYNATNSIMTAIPWIQSNNNHTWI